MSNSQETQAYKILMDLYLNVNDDADVIFVVHGEEVKAHKNIINLRSDALKAMVNSDLAPSDGRHLFADPIIEVEDFQLFVKFLYLDECEIDYDNVGALFRLGQMYLVPSLTDSCMEYIKKRCDEIDGILKGIEIGILYEEECPEILQFCFQNLSQTKFESFTVGQHRISVELLERIVKDCPRSPTLTEDDLLLKIFEWGQMECKQQNIAVDPKGMKKVLSPIMKSIKLEKLSIYSLANVIFPNQLVPTDQYVQYLVRHINRSRNGGNRYTVNTQSTYCRCPNCRLSRAFVYLNDTDDKE